MNINTVYKAMLKRAADNSAQPAGYGYDLGVEKPHMSPHNSFMAAKADFLKDLADPPSWNAWYHNSRVSGNENRPLAGFVVTNEHVKNWNDAISRAVAKKAYLPFGSIPQQTVKRIGQSIGAINRAKTMESGNPLPAFNPQELPAKDKEAFDKLAPHIQKLLLKVAPGYARNARNAGTAVG